MPLCAALYSAQAGGTTGRHGGARGRRPRQTRTARAQGGHVAPHVRLPPLPISQFPLSAAARPLSAPAPAAFARAAGRGVQAREGPGRESRFSRVRGREWAGTRGVVYARREGAAVLGEQHAACAGSGPHCGLPVAALRWPRAVPVDLCPQCRCASLLCDCGVCAVW